jgi:adenylate kinase
MGKIIVLMGPTGAGKSVQGDLLAQDLDGVHLSSGKLLRQDPKAAALITDGSLAPAEEVQRVVGDAIDGVPARTTIILDGLPRTMSDVWWLENELPKHRRELVRVVWIDLDIETSLKRLGLRGREDDRPEAVRRKYQELEEKTRPVFEHYDETGLLVHVDGRGSIEEVHEHMKAAIS